MRCGFRYGAWLLGSAGYVVVCEDLDLDLDLVHCIFGGMGWDGAGCLHVSCRKTPSWNDSFVEGGRGEG